MQARNGFQALDIYMTERPDLIILDVIMPKLDGYETARKIRETDPDTWIPIIFLSSMIGDNDIVQGIEAGGDDYLTKPVSQPVLAAKLMAMQRIAKMRCELLSISKQLESANTQLQQKSYRDGLTGVYNRRYFDEILPREWFHCSRNQTPLSVLLVDIDLFKKYNDSNGHLAGDDCLKNIAYLLDCKLRRPTDSICRYGGEEFVIILPETNESGAIHVAKRLNEAVNKLAIPFTESDLSECVSISIGCATVIPGSESISDDKLVMNADKALYLAKESGRNQVYCASHLTMEAA